MDVLHFWWNVDPFVEPWVIGCLYTEGHVCASGCPVVTMDFTVGGFYLGRWWWCRVMYPIIEQIQLRSDSWNSAQNVALASKTPLILIQSKLSQCNSGTNRSSRPTWPQESTAGAPVSATRGHADRSRVLSSGPTMSELFWWLLNHTRAHKHMNTAE